MNIGIDKNTGERIHPKKGASAYCQLCGGELIPNCGPIRIHYWAHKSKRNCDPWWESESEWHRHWKNEFPLEWHESVMTDPITDEKHRADVYIPTKELVIEFQKSPISLDEIQSREAFYKKMIWVVRADDFKFNCTSLNSLKSDIQTKSSKYLIGRINPQLKIPSDRENELWRHTNEKINQHYLNLCNIDDCMDYFEAEIDRVLNTDIPIRNLKDGIDPNLLRRSLVNSFTNSFNNKIDTLINKNKLLDNENEYVGYHWIRKRENWARANSPIFLDIANQLYLIKSDCILKKVSKDRFLKYYNN